MQLVGLQSMIPAQWDRVSFDEWQSSLQSICGHFNPVLHDGARAVTGIVRAIESAGIEFAHVANDLADVLRDHQDIRRDHSENLFLLMQLEGECGIEQKGRQEKIGPGDCILVDSTQPSRFHFGGRFSNHISVHLPRQILLNDRNVSLGITRKLDADDPMSTMLRALVAKLLDTDADDRRAPHLQALLFSATRQAFAIDGEIDVVPRSDSTGSRLEIVQVLIDRHLTEDHLSPQWLADRIGVSLRTLQDDFSTIGTTATSVIRMRRLNLARAQLARIRAEASQVTIAEIAYSSGFNDISYFNRCFKKAFDCSPKDLLNG